ncbi:hypothetical protein RCDURKIN_85 [Rhodobacter phage RcDurkin]|nr:hypothetical protein RCDURKIN_85 [Rhodobacter phage RcDurkin]QXN72555.1 hypothetical protein RCTIPTONUS_85 [Rhodobacter phage RcTiptonus]
MTASNYIGMDEGQLVDVRIEHLLQAIATGDHASCKYDIDSTFNALMHDYIGSALGYRINVLAVLKDGNHDIIAIASAMHFTVTFTFPSAHDWPFGGFPWAPNATAAASIRPLHGEFTEYSPGVDIPAAFFAALLEYMRRVSSVMLNQPTLLHS